MTNDRDIWIQLSSQSTNLVGSKRVIVLNEIDIHQFTHPKLLYQKISEMDKNINKMWTSIAITGDLKVGKSSLLRRINTNEFSMNEFVHDESFLYDFCITFLYSSNKIFELHLNDDTR